MGIRGLCVSKNVNDLNLLTDMKYLAKGQESKQRIALLLLHTKIESDAIKDAVVDHLCNGHSINASAMLNNVPQPNVSRALKALNHHAKIHEQLKELECDRWST